MELSCRGLEVAPGVLPDPAVPGFGGAGFGYQASYRANGAEKPADKATDFWKALHNQNKGDDSAFNRFNQQYNPKPRPMQSAPGRSAVAAVARPDGAAAKTGRCPQCRLPIGELAYHLNNDPKGPLVHGECQAQLMLQKSKEEEEARQKKDAEEKKARREQYEIGWKMDMIPLNKGPAAKLQHAALAGMCCLTLDEASNTVSLTAATDPATSVNLEYLSLALQVRTRGGRDPMFSLDPKLGSKAASPDELHSQWQVKRFEPEWLAGTSVGEVMFQADVHLKELSMGEYAQPVVGMKSCFEFLKEEGLKAEWCAREWFVVKRAEVLLSGEGEGGSGVLVPFVEMGVEAREQIRHPDHVEDAPLTRKDHPLVKYADEFTRYFDVIAERKSVIYHIRELGKAAVLAKFLVDSKVNLEDTWYDLAGEAQALRNPEIPQLWNERCHTSIQVRDGKIVDAGKDATCAKLQGVYGGVEFGTDRVQVVGFRRPVAAVMTEIPRGVDLNLDSFNLSAPRRSSPSGGCTILEGKDAKAPLGSAFWKSIVPGLPSAFAEGNKSVFRDLFNPHLSDRRSEGELFVPPDPNAAYVQKLQKLLQEEASAINTRKGHFCSESFDMGKADPLFPASWAPSADIVKQEPAKMRWVPPGGGHSQSRVKLHSSAPGMERIVEREAPVFDKATEDGTRFRIYQVGGLELRTIQEDGKKEVVGAVFSSRGPAKGPTIYMGAGVKDSEIFVKVLEYVEGARDGAKQFTDCRYYIVLETDQGNTVVTERLPDRSLTWEENPMGLEARNYLAKVTRFAECRNACVTVAAMKAHRQAEVQRGSSGVLASELESYAHGVFTRANQPSKGPPAFGGMPFGGVAGLPVPGGFAAGGYSAGGR